MKPLANPVPERRVMIEADKQPRSKHLLAGFILLAIMCTLVCWSAAAQVAAPGMTREIRIPMLTPAGEHLTLEGRVYDQDDGRRHAAVVLSHGAPRGGQDKRRDPNYANLFAIAQWFQAQGYVVITAKRRGYGTSEGRFAEYSGTCEHRNFRAEGLTSANDIQAAVDYARSLSSVDASRIILAGVSAGGWGSLALATRGPKGVIGVVNFAGGRGSVADMTNCDVPSLIGAAADYGQAVKIPSIWLYAVNDRYVPPSVSNAIYQAFRAATASRTEYVALPALGRDGHLTFHLSQGVKNWEQPVSRFLSTVRAAPGDPPL